MRRILLALILCLCFSSALHAQDDAPPDLRTVYVTTQDNASLRAGPGRNWERLAVIPFGTTLRATGRTLNADWIQVAYTGQRASDAYPEATIDGVTYGWIASELLIWTGSVLELTVDGVPTVNFARAAGRLILLTPDEPIYTGLVGPTERVPYPLEGMAYIEATGRLGRGENFHYWVQVKANGQFYWVSALGVPSSSLPDASYLYSVGRLNIAASRNQSRLSRTLGDIASRWEALSAGQPTTCNNIPPDFALLTFSEADIAREPVYAALNTAFTEAKAATDRAVARFRDVCATASISVTAEIIRLALADVAEAQRLLNVINLLLEPFEGLDPYNNAS
jgi:uncharacterized protein YraI